MVWSCITWNKDCHVPVFQVFNINHCKLRRNAWFIDINICKISGILVSPPCNNVFYTRGLRYLFTNNFNLDNYRSGEQFIHGFCTASNNKLWAAQTCNYSWNILSNKIFMAWDWIVCDIFLRFLCDSFPYHNIKER